MSVLNFFTLNCRGKLLSLEEPKVMGILNLTPDSFSDGGKYNQLDRALKRVEVMLQEGADIIDIGGYSSRPNAPEVTMEEELRRIQEITAHIITRFPEAIISIDTFRSQVAKEMLDIGVHMINDISGGSLDPLMMETVASYRAPYVLMHMKGNPQSMQKLATYEDVRKEVFQYFVSKINSAREVGIVDLIIDLGFGFGKTIQHNFSLIHQFETFSTLDFPILAGISRKSMLYRTLGTTPEEVIPAGSALHLILLQRGAHLLRVHDVAEAAQIVNLFSYMRSHGFI